MYNFSDHLIDKLKTARRLVFFTGAGISAESGVPTFRGENGIWKKFSAEELANFDAFMRNPDLVWEWYQHRREVIHATEPNAGHYAIKQLEEYFESVIIVTQNIDNLHRRAKSSTIYELHGNMEKNYCINCKKRYDFVDFEDAKESPKCECGGLIRPDIVWFGENLPSDQFDPSQAAVENCDILFTIGTSGIVYPAAYLPMNAHKLGKFVVEINPVSTELSPFCNEILRFPSAEILPKIVEKVRELRA